MRTTHAQPTPADPASDSSAPPLSTEELAEAEQVARRLHDEFRAVVDALAESRRGASAISRALDVDRATCQRIVGVAVRPQVGPEALAQLPGVQGLRQFLAAVAERSASHNAEQLAAANAAVDRFDQLLDRFGGSQRRLRARLGLDPSARGGPAKPILGGADDIAAREALFRAAAAVTGRWSELTIETRLVRPLPENPGLTEGVRIRGLIGHSARADAVPLEMGESAPLRTDGSGPAFETLQAQPASGSTPRSLLPAFCTEPLPRVVSRSSGDRVFHMIDTSGTAASPADIVMAHRSSKPDRHPATLRPAVGEMLLLINFPARRMLFDIFVHRDIARRCIPSAEVHLFRSDAHGPAIGWTTRFAGSPRLEVLGSGLSRTAAPSYARYTELLGGVYDQLGWDAGDFVGYRCEATFPVWRAAYCMLFDFTGNEIGA